MRYLTYTHVDVLTGLSVEQQPANNGPTYPVVRELTFGFAAESLYPARVPKFFGTCADDAELTAPGVTGELTAEQYQQAHLDEHAARLEKSRGLLRDAVTGKRWAIETGGLTLPNGVRVSTGTEDQNRITTVTTNAQLAGVSAVDFKAASGWVTLTLAEVQSIAAAVAQHVQACFSAERTHHEGIVMLDSVEAIRTYDIAAGWPSSATPA